MNDEIFNRLQKFVVEESCVDDEVITRETKIQDDLGVSGDDAVEFIMAYSKVFNVDVSQFMAADYFDGEGIDIVGSIIRVVTGDRRVPRKVLTVGHLEKAAIAGRLDEDVINS